jgi:hypothetical protein
MVNALRADRHELLKPARNATSDSSERLTGNRCRGRVAERQLDYVMSRMLLNAIRAL